MELRYENKVIGTLNGSVFTKKVKASVHLLYKRDAWGIDLIAFEKHLKYDKIIKIIDLESNKTYEATSQTFEEHGFTENLGHGEQIFLERKWFSTANPNQPKLI